MISVRLSEVEQALISDFAKSKGWTVSEFARRAMMEQVEDEYDLKLAMEAYEEYLADPVTYSWEEVVKELNLDV